jgi:aminocarboxymuconate-semialdehyde decarboxylase
MRSIDIHAHLMPHCMLQTLYRGDTWHGVSGERNAQGRLVYGLGGRRQALTPQFAWNTGQRLADMDSLGVDVQVVSTFVGYYPFPSDAQAIAACREANDEVRQMASDYPDRFAGLCTLPMQHLQAAINELERSVTHLGLKGAMLNDTINGQTFDAPELLPFWQAAEQLGALIFVHQGGPTVVSPRADRYHLPNTIGNLADRAVTFASLVFGGVMDKCPDLKVCLAHGGGYTCFGIGRMDRGWQVRAEARAYIQQPPSAYLSKFYYDCLTHSEAALRMLIDTVGIDRVVFGTDWPADMAIDWPVAWVLGLESLTQEEKEAILYKNLEQLLSI